ncbi:hypothetical protein SteCoe_33249 [Stentor coeruleus]|uniref:Ig-like domain-containing protein n=1 Tax=Stentor coeruleus TaxID=5963 RepID=A0A1R2AXA0_9CILI|nr:hypothetical protein SteCoe_33249 [Stentor coeruleus]
MGPLNFLLLVSFGQLAQAVCYAEYSPSAPSVYTLVSVEAISSYSTGHFTTNVDSSFEFISSSEIIDFPQTGISDFDIYYKKSELITSKIECGTDLINLVESDTDTFAPKSIVAVLSNVANGLMTTSYQVTGSFTNQDGTPVTVYNGLTVTLKLLSSSVDVTANSLLGTTTTTTSGGSFSFSGLQVKNGGTFQFQAALDTFSGLSNSFIINDHQITTVSFKSPLTFDAYKDYDFDIMILDENGDIFTISSTISLSLSDSSTIGGYSKGTTTSGSYSFSGIYFQTSGSVTLSFIVETSNLIDKKTIEEIITINKASLSFQSFTFSTIGSQQTVTIDIKDYSGDLVTAAASFTCTLTLLNLGQTSINLVNGGSASSSSSKCTYQDVRITNSGTYTLKATVAEAAVNSYTSGEFPVTSSIVSITIKPSTEYLSYITYFLYSFDILLYGEGNFEYLEDATIELTVDGGVALGGATSSSTKTGSLTLNNIYFKNSGTRTITASAKASDDNTWSDVTGTLTKEVSNLKIQIQTFEAFSNIGDISDISIKFTNSDGDLRTAAEEIDCNIELKNSDGSTLTLVNLEIDSIISNTKSQTSVSGQCTFSRVRIIRSGSYAIYFSSDNTGTETDTTDSFPISSSVTTVEIKSTDSITSFTTYFIYSFTVGIFGEGGFNYLESCDVTLSLANSITIYGYSPRESIVDGTVTFEGIYFDTSGSLSLKATVSSVDSSELSLTVAEININLDNTIALSTIASRQDLTFSFVDDNGNIRTSDKEFSCIAELYNSLNVLSNTYLEATITPVSSGGICCITNARIKVSGTNFYLMLHSSDSSVKEVSSTPFSITSSLQSMTFTLANGPYTVYFTYQLTVNVFGEGSFSYLEDVTIALIMDDNSEIGDYTEASTSDGTHQFNIYFTSTVSKVLKITATQASDSKNTLDKTADLSLDVLNVNIDFTSISTISDLTVVTATIADDASLTEAVNGNYHCVLTLQDYSTELDNDSISGTLEVDDINGVCTFNDIRVTRSGSYRFKVQISMTNVNLLGVSEKVTVTSSVKTVTISVVNTTPSIYFDFDVSVSIKVEGDYDFLEPCTITIIADDYSTIENPSFDTNTGSATMTIYVKSTTLASIVAVVSGVISNTVPITPTPLKFTLDATVGSVNTNPDSSDDSFELEVNVRNIDDEIESKNYNSGSYSFTITLAAESTSYSGTTILYSDTAYSNGIFSSQTSSGTKTLSGLKILSSGDFTVTVSSTFSPTITTAFLSFSIINSIKKVTLSSLEPSPTSNIDFSVKIKALGDDDNPFILGSDFSIFNGLNNIGACTLDSDGVCTTQINFAAKGTFTIEANSADTSATDSIDVIVSNMVIKINEALEETYTSDNILSLSVTTYDCTGVNLVTTEADTCEITISLSDEVNFSGTVLFGTLTGPLNNGVATFNDIKILSSGEFNIYFTSACDYIDNIKSNTRITVTNSIKTITLSLAEEATIYFLFNADVTILGDDDNNYLAECHLTLSIDNDHFIGESTTMTTTGEASFSIYFESIAAKVLKASCSEDKEIADSKTITILKEIIKVNPSKLPETGLDTFSVTVTIWDNQGAIKISESQDTNNYEITLRLYCVDDSDYRDEFFNIEDSTLTIDAGTVTFSNLNVWKTGNYIIKATASSDNIENGESNEFSVIVYIFKMNIDYPELIYSFFDFSLKVTLFGPNDEVYSDSTEVIIENENLQGVLSIKDTTILSTGVINFDNIHFINYRDITIKVSGITNDHEDYKTFTISVIPSIIILTLDSNINRRLTDSTESFSLTASVYNFEDGELSSYTNTILLSIEPVSTLDFYSGTKLDGEISFDTNLGSCSFKNIRILSFGKFRFKASSSGLISGYTTEEITIENAIKSILITYNSEEDIIRDIQFEVEISIIGEDDNLYIGSVEIELDQTPYWSFNGLETYTNDIGSKKIQVTPLRSGPISITISVTDLLGNPFSKTLDLVSHKAAIEVIFNEIPADSLAEFTITIYAYDDVGVLTNSQLLSNLALTCKVDSSCSGFGITGITKGEFTIPSSGFITYQGCKILSSGDLILTISANDYISSEISFTSFKNYIKSINIDSLTSNPSVNFLVSLTVTLIGDDDLRFILPATVELSELNNYSFTGDISLLSTTGQTIHNIRFTNAKTYNIKAGSTINSQIGQLSVVVNKGIIKLILPGDPYYDSKEFIVSAEVYDNSGTILESGFGIYTFTLFTEPAVVLASNSLKTTAGKGSLSILINKTGTYTVNIKNSDFIDAITNSITIKEGIKAITTTAKLEQGISTLFELPLKITNQNGANFIRETVLNISCDAADLHGESLSITTSNSTASFWIYFTTVGTKKCTVQSSYTVSVSFTFTIISTKVNTDFLCNIGITANRCYKCKDAAKKSSNETCTCGGNSYYDNSTSLCVCETGFEVDNGFCVKCGWYFKPEEITGYYAEDYKGIIMEFKKSVAQSKEGSCNSIVTVADSLKENFLSCSWLNPSKLIIAFSKIVNGEEFYMELDPSLVQYVKSGDCSKNVFELKILISNTKFPKKILISNTKYPKPTPSASITAPSSLSIGCDADMDIIIMTKNVNSDYTYKWSSKITPENSVLSDLISKQTTPSFSVSLKTFTVGEVDIHLVIESITFGTSSSSDTKITISGDKEIMAQMSVGNALSIKKSDTLPIKPAIINACGTTGPYTYEWSYTEDSTDDNFDFESFIAKQKKEDTILISPNDLNSGITYKFTVMIKSGDIEGSASIALQVNSNPIEIQFLRSSGSVGSSSDLSIAIQVIDPDDSTAVLEIEWSCLEGAESCVDTNSKDLLKDLDVNSFELIIPKDRLRNEALYSFIVKASANDKSTTGQIDMEINENIKGGVKIKPFQGPVNNELAVIIIPEVEAYPGIFFKWTFSPALEVSDIDITQSFMYIPPNSLKYSINYQLTLQMYEFGKEDSAATGFIVITRDAPPQCGSFTVTEGNDGKLKLEIVECSDNTSLVLAYQYGFINKRGTIIPLTIPLYTTPVELRVPNYVKTLELTVCDTMETCSSYTADVPDIQNSRQLDESDLLVSIAADIIDSDYIPSSIIYYAGIVTEEATYNYLFDVNFAYFAAEEFDSFTFNIFLSTMQALIESSYFTNTTVSDDILTNVTISLLDYITAYSNPITQDQADFIFNLLAPYISRIDFDTLKTIYEIVADSQMSNMLLNGNINYTDGVSTIFRYRNSGDGLRNTDIVAGNNLISFYNISGFNDTDVLDIYFTKFPQDYDFFEIIFYVTGSYESYALVLNSESNATTITVEDNVIAQIEGNYDNGTNYKCEYLDGNSWSSSGCNVEDVNENYAILTLMHLSTFRIKVDEGKNCDVGAGPIATMSVIIFLMIFLIIIFVLSDKKVDHPSVNNSFLLLYPLTSVFIQQAKSRRAVIVIQILTSEILMLTLIGAFHNYFDSPEDKTDNVFDNYYGFQLSRGAAAWALTQAFTIPIFILNAFILKGKPYYLITIPVCIFITVGCFCGLIVMTVFYCLGWTEYWIANWLIFLLFDIATLEFIYALVFSRFIKVNAYEAVSKDSSVKTPNDSQKDDLSTRRQPEVQEDSDDYEIIADQV